MALTKGEMVKVAGKLVTNIGEALDEPDTPNEITKEEALEMIQNMLTNLLEEFSD